MIGKAKEMPFNQIKKCILDVGEVPMSDDHTSWTCFILKKTLFMY